MVGVLAFDILPGLFIGVAMSDKNRWVDLRRNPDALPEPGIVVLRPEGGLIYTNADNVAAAVHGHLHGDTRAVVLDSTAVPDIDFTAVEMLDRLSADLQHRHTRLHFAGEIGQVRDLLSATGIRSFVADKHRPSTPAVTVTCRDLDHPPSI